MCPSCRGLRFLRLRAALGVVKAETTAKSCGLYFPGLAGVVASIRPGLLHTGVFLELAELLHTPEDLGGPVDRPASEAAAQDVEKADKDQGRALIGMNMPRCPIKRLRTPRGTTTNGPQRVQEGDKELGDSYGRLL